MAENDRKAFSMKPSNVPKKEQYEGVKSNQKTDHGLGDTEEKREYYRK